MQTTQTLATALIALALTVSVRAQAPGAEPTLAERQTVAHQVKVAQGCRTLNQPAKVAEAIWTASLLPGGEGAAEVIAERPWLKAKSNELYEAAVAAQKAGDLKGAVKAYLVAVKCDTATLGRDDMGLKDIALGALKKMAAKSPEKKALQYQLGFYSYLFGDLAGAQEAFAAAAQGADAYGAWRCEIWKNRVLVEYQKIAADERAAAATRTAARNAAPAGEVLVGAPAAPAAEPSAESHYRREEIAKEIAKIDKEIEFYEGTRKKTQASSDGNKVSYTYYNQKQVTGYLEKLQERKKALENENASI